MTNPSLPSGRPPASEPEPGVRGIKVLAGIVVLGLASGFGLFQLSRPAKAKARADLEAELALPHDPESRLDQWLRYGAPQIHHRLSQFARFSPEHPWLVTHAVIATDGGDPELWGIDCAALPRHLARREGRSVVIDLPAPTALGRIALTPRMGEHVPLIESGQAFDAAERLRGLALYLLERIPAALERDLPGTTVEIRVAPPPTGS